VEEDEPQPNMLLTERSPFPQAYQRDMLNESSVEEEDTNGNSPVNNNLSATGNIAIIGSKEGGRQRPSISPLDLTHIVKNREGRRDMTKSEEPGNKIYTRLSKPNNETQ
jgi:hypothetical protein